MSDARDPVTYDCPACKQPVQSPAWQARQGIRCGNCNTGFIPVKIEAREIGIKPEPVWLKWFLAGIIFLFAWPLFYIFWPIAVVLLLAAIAWLLWKIQKKHV